MTNQFHKTLNFMALIVAVLFILLGVWHVEFLELASTNYVINGIIIGTGLFGIGLCFYEMMRLVPEYRWLAAYTHGRRNMKLPPRILRQIATILQRRPCRIYADTLAGLMDMIAERFISARESIRFITSSLIFLGLFGTFWGLITTLGGFGDLISGLNMDDIDVMTQMQNGLAAPLMGMATAFTSSLLGLGASLIVGLLDHLVGIAHNTIYTEIGDYMAAHTHTVDTDSPARVLPNIDLNTQKITAMVQNIERNSVNE